jgi:hypothetical protein
MKKSAPFSRWPLATVLLVLIAALPRSVSANGFPTIYWLGSEGTSWTAASNWSSDFDGTSRTDFSTDAYINFSATNSTNSSSTVLDGDQVISSLTINSTNPVGISGVNNLTVTGNIYVGNFTSNNSLEISNGAAVSAVYMSAGYLGGANNNQVIVGANATLTLADKFDVGFDESSSSNSLTIRDGGKVFCKPAAPR